MKSGFIQYIGSKARLSEHIIKLMPKHESYIEPFFGSGAVFFNKAPVKHELVNDAHHELYKFLLYMQHHGDAMKSEIKKYSYNEALYEDITSGNIKIPTELHRIAMWYIVRAMNYRGTTNSFGIISSINNVIEVQRIAKIDEYLDYYIDRIKNACITNKDVFKLLECDIKSNALIYLDPPYLFEDNRVKNYYQFDCNDFTRKKTHAKLKGYMDELTEKNINIICSYKEHDLLYEWYGEDDRYIIEEIKYQSSVSKERIPYKELLILNYKPLTYGKNKTLTQFE